MDGFPILFYKVFREVTRAASLDFIHEFQARVTQLGRINYPQVVLIPKKGAKEVGDCRPICLMNGSLKISAKALANRLKAVLPTMIEKYQTGYSKGRSILKVPQLHKKLPIFLSFQKDTSILAQTRL